MSFYVMRQKAERIGWVGPITSRRQAEREAKAWVSCAWDATIFESNRLVRDAVRAWEKANK